MFFLIPSQPMEAEEEGTILSATGCSIGMIDTLLSFAEKYRQSMSTDNVQKNRKLGTRSLIRIARRLAMFPQDDDLNAVIRRSLLADFLPTVERMNLDTLFEETGIWKKEPLACGFILAVICVESDGRSYLTVQPEPYYTGG